MLASGRQVEVQFCQDEFRNFSRTTLAVSVNGIFYKHITVQQLGYAARAAVGLPAKTPLHITTRVVWNTRVLPRYQPVISILCADNTMTAHTSRVPGGRTGDFWYQCYFCGDSFRYEDVYAGPFRNCLFCGDEPAWHHGWCCPCNPESSTNKGFSHQYKILGSEGASKDGSPEYLD